jgi:cytosine/adenosine deaminase-related metal-dependent hydrolase
VSAFLLRGGTLVTLDLARRVLVGDILVRAGRIVALGEISPQESEGARVIDATGMAVLPGLVQTHIHLCQTLLRNGADDLRLLDWLRCRVWPMEGAHTPESLATSCDVGIAELLLGGTTTLLDMGTVHHQDTVFERLAAWGIRAAAGKAMMDFGDEVPASLRETTAHSLAESRALIARWHGSESGRLRYAYAPRFALSCSDELLRAVGRDAEELDVLIHTHASEQRDECAIVEALRGDSNIAYLRDTGIYGPRAVLAHCVWPTERELGMLAKDQTRVAHCPSSNLKLGSGVAPIVEMLSRGIQVSLGADGAPCNNRLDGFEELRLAALLQKPLSGPASLPARRALEMATLDGARALGLAHEIGSLEVGKKADIIAVDLRGAHHLPGGDVYAALVYCARASDVRTVLVDGALKVESGQLVQHDPDELRHRASRTAEALQRRAGLL